MEFTIKNNHISSTVHNNLAAAGHLAASFVVAFAVNKAAHAVFKIEEGSIASKAVRIGSFAAGVAASVSLLPYSNLVPFTGSEIRQLLVISVLLDAAIYVLFRRMADLGIGMGAVIGYLGSRSLVPFGAIGALVGAIM